MKTRRQEPIDLYNHVQGFPVWFDPNRYFSIMPDVLTGTPNYQRVIRFHNNVPGNIEKDWVLGAKVVAIAASRIDNAVLNIVVRGPGWVKLAQLPAIKTPHDLIVCIEACSGRIISAMWADDALTCSDREVFPPVEVVA